MLFDLFSLDSVFVAVFVLSTTHVSSFFNSFLVACFAVASFDIDVIDKVIHVLNDCVDRLADKVRCGSVISE